MNVIVIGVDGTETAAMAARRAGEIAAAMGAKIHVVSAYIGRTSTTMDVGSDSFVLSEHSIAEQTAEQQAAAYRSAGVEATAAVADGKPANVILEQAERVGATMIVVGNRRMQGMQRVLGAVANDVVHHAPCDVLVVKTV